MRAILTVALLLTAALSAHDTAPKSVRTAQVAQAPSRTGLLVGQVVDAASGRPIAETVVTLATPGMDASLATTPKGRVMTGADGRFLFGELPPGNYSITAAKPGYVGGAYGRRRPDASTLYCELADGERRADVTILLWKFATITGTVVDEFGEPMVGVGLTALRRTVVSGRRVFWPTLAGYPGASVSATTDDRGIYRFANLVPGDYVVALTAAQTTVPASVLTPANGGGQNPAQSEIFSVINEISPLGSARNQQVGDYVLMTPSARPVPPSPDAAGRFEMYPTTFYPSAASASQATLLSVASGDERVGVNLQVRPVPSVRVSGRLAGPAGAVGPIAVRLVPTGAAELASESGFETVSGVSDANGVFTLLGVPSGQYQLKVLGPRASPGQTQSTPEKPVLWASESLTVGGADIANLAITLRPTTTISGRVEFQGSAAPPKSSELLASTITLVPAEKDSGAGNLSARLDAAGNFATGAPAGLYLVRAYPTEPWFVKSITVGGRDLLQAPLDLKSEDTTGMVITYTDQPSRLTGTVRTAQGAGDPNAAVLIFPADPQAWIGFAANADRLRSMRAGRTGAYRVVGLLPGQYLVVAVDDGLIDGWQDPKNLEALSRTATRVTMRDGEQRTVDLKTGPVR